MDLTLKTVPMEGYACPLETTVYQEETQESIVPDACPDILTIIATEGKAQFIRKECLEGKAEVQGSIRVSVVYIPDGEECLRHLELNIPFRASAAAPGLTPACSLVAVPRVTAADTRMLNPRKVLCRVELAVWLQGWVPAEDVICTPWEDEEPVLQQQTRQFESYVTMAAAEKSFAFTDEVDLTAGRPAARELLGHRIGLRCGEAKVIGNKLIFKGEATLQVRYRTQDNTLATGSWVLPFSQIMEVNGVEEEGSCSIDIVERESEVKLADAEEGRTLAVHMELLAQAVIRQTRQISLFTDAYSVSQQVTVERHSYQLTQLWEESGVTQLGREVLETPMMPRSVEDCFVAMGQPQVVREAQTATLSVECKVTVLYTDEDGRMASVTRPLTVSAQVSMPPEGICKAKCALDGELQAVATGAGIEVRCPVRFSYLTTLDQSCDAVAALQVEDREAAEERPSVILRMAQPGECLWDIAKAYSTTQQDILAANELPDPDHLEGALLLIPRSR